MNSIHETISAISIIATGVFVGMVSASVAIGWIDLVVWGTR